MLERYDKVSLRLICTPDATFQRGRDGAWYVAEVSLYYRDGLPSEGSFDPDLAQVATIESVESISLHFANRRPTISAKGIQSLKALKHLRALGLLNLSAGLDLMALADLPDIEELDLRGFGIYSDPSLASQTEDLVALKHFPKLRRLDLDGRRLNDESLDYVASIKGLEVLVIGGNWEITDAGIAKLKALENLRELSLPIDHTTAAGAAQLSGLKKLRTLRLRAGQNVYEATRFPVQEVTPKSLSKLANLEKLSISPVKVTPELLAELKALPNLRKLSMFGEVSKDLGKLDLSSVGLRELGIDLGKTQVEVILPKSLQKLEVGDEQQYRPYRSGLAACPKVLVVADAPSAETLSALGPLDNPMALDLGVMEDSTLKDIAAIAPKHLREVTVTSMCGHLTDEGIKSLSLLQDLESLTFETYAGPISEAGIEALGKLPKLQRLDLGTQTTFGGVKAIGGLKGLRTLSLCVTYGSKEPSTTLDDALPSWSGLARLERLKLSGATITDKGLAHLAAIKTLHVLELEGCGGWTADGLASLMQSLPELQTVKVK